jgi:hypothetical protein
MATPPVPDCFTGRRWRLGASWALPFGASFVVPVPNLRVVQRLLGVSRLAPRLRWGSGRSIIARATPKLDVLGILGTSCVPYSFTKMF